MKGLRAISVFLLAGLLLAGCSAAARESARLERTFKSETAPAEPMAEAKRSADAESAAGAIADNASTTLPSTRMVIKTAALSVRVKDVAGANTRAIQLAEAGGGYVQSSSQYVEGGERADLSIRVPPEGFLPLIRSLEALGQVDAKSISGEDVTEEYYDLDARLENLTQVRSRLFALLDRAVKVTDAVEVERELERVGGELNRIEGRMRYLTTMVGLSTINLTLSTEERPAVEAFINWALVGNGFVVAARTLVQALFFILQAIVVVAPIAAVAAAAAFGIWRLVRWLRGRGGAPAKAAGRAAQSRRR